ncbi:MAG: polyphosphate polymerase domain-containing protein [Bacilli bacterium]
MKKGQVFNRKEIKYVITKHQKEDLVEYMQNYMVKDKYSDKNIISVYIDTPSKRLIRNSMEKPMYKEKLRIRSYGVANDSSEVFMEIKKKFKGIVYKRRVSMSCDDANCYLKGKNLDGGQVLKEVDYLKQVYGNLEKSMYMSYYREAYKCLEDEHLRVTFDSDVVARVEDISLTSEIYGHNILDENLVIMEIKTLYGFPEWLNYFLSNNKIYKTPFSKYGKAYKDLVLNQGGEIC